MKVLIAWLCLMLPVVSFASEQIPCKFSASDIENSVPKAITASTCSFKSDLKIAHRVCLDPVCHEYDDWDNCLDWECRQYSNPSQKLDFSLLCGSKQEVKQNITCGGQLELPNQSKELVASIFVEELYKQGFRVLSREDSERASKISFGK